MVSREVKRQAIHMCGASIPFLAIAVGKGPVMVVIGVAVGMGLAAARAYRQGWRNTIFSLPLEYLERPGVIETSPAKGALFYGIGIFLTLLLFDQRVAFPAIMVASLGDGGSTLAGMRFGRHRLAYNREKTVEGSVGGFVLALAGTLLVAPSYMALMAAAVGMAVESLPQGIDDNLTIPLAVAVVLSLAG